MNVNEFYPGRYVKSGDIEEDMPLTIRSVERTDDPAIDPPKPVLFFDEIEQGFILNKTNLTTLATAFGKETNSWPAEQIVLYPTEVSYQGKMVPSVRVRTPRRKATNGGATKLDDAYAKAKSRNVVSGGKQPPTRDVVDDIPF